jgi:hypothetical protein
MARDGDDQELARHGRSRAYATPNEQRNLNEAQIDGYLDRWDLLKQDTTSIRFLADSAFVPLIGKHGLPECHPGVKT